MEQKVWHSFYPEGTPPEVELQKITMPEVLESTTGDYPDSVAYIYMGKVITYRELKSLVYRFANALADLGVKPEGPQDRLDCLTDAAGNGVSQLCGTALLRNLGRRDRGGPHRRRRFPSA